MISLRRLFCAFLFNNRNNHINYIHFKFVIILLLIIITGILVIILNPSNNSLTIHEKSNKLISIVKRRFGTNHDHSNDNHSDVRIGNGNSMVKHNDDHNNSSDNYHLTSLSSSSGDYQIDEMHNAIDIDVPMGNRTSSTIRFGGYGYDTMKIAITVCGDDHLEQSLMTLKSAVVLTKNRLHFVIMADDANMKAISKKILEWPNIVLQRISYEVHSVSFPNVENVHRWKKLFKLCASQRLFLPSILSNIDALLYVDTDVLFLTPVDEIWSFFLKMNNTHMAGMTPESEDFASGWYNRFARHPFVRPLGVNSGVMLMNLTRMRTFGWHNYLEPLLMQYKLNIVWGDQDIINIIFHYHMDKLYIFPCNWNYRPDHCIYTSVCKDAVRSGVAIIHGNRGVFHNDKQLAFRSVYRAFAEYNFDGDIRTKLLNKMEFLLQQTVDTNCGAVWKSIVKALENTVNSLTIKSDKSVSN